MSEAQKHYDEAFRKLASGKGNVIRQAEMLREMGVKPSKLLPTPFVDAASAEDYAALPANVAAVEAAMAAHPSRLPAPASLTLPEPPMV